MPKTTITIALDSKIKKILEKRAKRELFSLEELISDILRRSATSYHGASSESDKVDDKLLTLFSRKTKKK